MEFGGCNSSRSYRQPIPRGALGTDPISYERLSIIQGASDCPGLTARLRNCCVHSAGSFAAPLLGFGGDDVEQRELVHLRYRPRAAGFPAVDARLGRAYALAKRTSAELERSTVTPCLVARHAAADCKRRAYTTSLEPRRLLSSCHRCRSSVSVYRYEDVRIQRELVSSTFGSVRTLEDMDDGV